MLATVVLGEQSPEHETSTVLKTCVGSSILVIRKIGDFKNLYLGFSFLYFCTPDATSFPKM